MANKIFSIPNIITIGRLSLIPVFILCFYLDNFWRFPVSFLIFGLAMLTDWLDSYVARRLKVVSKFGAFLDPLADKLLVVVALILLSAENTAWFFSLSVIIIILREILISALREWLANIGKSLTVSSLGKLKTVLQMVSIFFLLINIEGTRNLGYIMLMSAAFLSIVSFMHYCLVVYKSFYRSV